MPDMNQSRLRRLAARPDFEEFRRQFDRASARRDCSRDELREIGTDAFEAFLEPAASADSELFSWFVEQCRAGAIVTTNAISAGVRRLERATRRQAERVRYSEAIPALQTRRIVQLSWFGSAGFHASDLFEVRQSIYRSPQLRQFCAAAALRFPGLTVLPNYPIREIVNLEKLERLVTPAVAKYGKYCAIDVILTTPREGDPVVAFDLQDDTRNKRHDDWKNSILAAAGIPLFRLGSEDASATSIDEWYSVLTDEVLDKI